MTSWLWENTGTGLNIADWRLCCAEMYLRSFNELLWKALNNKYFLNLAFGRFYFILSKDCGDMEIDCQSIYELSLGNICLFLAEPGKCVYMLFYCIFW